MAIKATLGEAKPQNKKPFPKLMKYNKAHGIVLFSKPKCGVVISGNIYDFWQVGHYISDWAMEEFTDYNEPITLQNK